MSTSNRDEDRKDLAVDSMGHHLADGPMSAAEVTDAYHATVAEHEMSFAKAVKAYRKAVWWSCVMGCCIIMQQFDVLLINQYPSLPAFQRRFGLLSNAKTHAYQLTPAWQSGLSGAGSVGLIIGYVINGFTVDRFGHRYCAMVICVLVTALIFILFFAKSLPMILAGEILLRIPLGSINSISASYSIEMVPLTLRHYGPTFVHLCEVFGHILASGLLNIWVADLSQWAWRIPFAIEWVFPLPLFILILFAPDSPWWLARKGRDADARQSLDRMTDGSVDTEEVLQLIKHTIRVEKATRTGGTFWHIFKGPNLRRTEIALGVFLANVLGGFGIPSPVYFFEVAGFSAKNAFQLNVGNYAIAGGACIVAMALLQRVGRRPIWLFGTIGMLVGAIVIASLAMIPHQTPAVVWPQGILVLVRAFFFGISHAALPYLIATEICSVRLRQLTLSFTFCIYQTFQVLSQVTSPYLLNPGAANLKGKAVWIAAGFDALILVWSYFRLPETKGRTIEELDWLFAKGISTREFKTYIIAPEEQFGINPDAEGKGETHHVETVL